MINALKYIGILCLFCFSFFYTNKAVTVVREVDPIMVKIREEVENYNKDSIDALIKGNEIIPGVNGCVIDINNSYKNMKRINTYNPNFLKFKEVPPSVSILGNYDKYIVSGNGKNREVSLIVNMLDKENVELILHIIKSKELNVNFFVDGNFIEKNLVYINDMKEGNEIYNSGYDGLYDRAGLLWTNSLIESFSYNKSMYCLNSKKNDDILKLCSRSKMYTIMPSFVINNNNFIQNISNISNGSIIYIDNRNINAINNTINYLKKRGFKFVVLSDLLSEKGCI